ncbi:NADP-dependent oxidoreductase domain-containing protein [Lipomyces tetrasporus]|uniref:NADP-dependent oxidoreductase domain-containing protein n=1 Tax=Lipomyces tetrasporus TaxID=54092 RepID=A0AAD7QYV6_9ASCO|nr:NADP-dependent oxidoreductase domain-containing protein [Lipomyces tetrasporus]KAJ8102332.1 NADP-dependent oxidoreductase domain-containing protein [Lipomyces tetrasporus]
MSLTVQSTLKLSSEAAIPRIEFGAYLANEEAVYNALHAGYRMIDTAEFYHNEAECGSALARWLSETGSKREDVYYVTKLWNSHHGELAANAINDSLRRANLDYIDLYLIHSPLSSRKLRLETWKVMQEAVKAGKIKSIGVSNYGIHHLQELLDWPDLEIKPSVNQLEVHPWLPRKDIVSFCNEHDIVVEAYSPLTRGERFKEPVVQELCKKYNKTPAQILIRWSLQQGLVPIPKSNNQERIKTNLDVFGYSISEEDMTKLDIESYAPVTWDPTRSGL